MHEKGQVDQVKLYLNLAKELKDAMTKETNKLQSSLKQVLGYLGVPFEFKSEITDLINQIIEGLES